MEYVIHACEPRMWYVDEYLIPSMIAQGIKSEDIRVWLDREHKGNLHSCMECFLDCENRKGAIWHMQDDVAICRNFAKRTREFTEDEIVNGFCGRDICQNLDKQGEVLPAVMWFSHQCILIPNHLAAECARWFYDDARHRDRWLDRVAKGKSDDYFWLHFLQEVYPTKLVTNLVPNLVEHVDYLLGGSVINYTRTVPAIAAFFKDQDLIYELENRLIEDGRL